MLVIIFTIIFPCTFLLSGCFSDDKKNNQTETPQASTTTINFYYQNGNDLKSSINVDLSTTYYCAIGVENANFYETSGYYTEKNGQGIAVYDVVNNYTPAFKSFCEGKTFMGYFTGENGTGEQITDTTGKSLKPWVIKENNHYYKPYEDYIIHEYDYGLKIYAYYI